MRLPRRRFHVRASVVAMLFIVLAVAGIGTAVVVGWTAEGGDRLAREGVHESLRLDFEAAPRQGQGAGTAREVFDRSSTFVPYERAPLWSVVALYERTGPPAENVEWHGSLEYRILDDSGGVSWKTQRAVPVEDHGGEGRFELDVALLVREAEALAASMGPSERVDLRISVHHVSVVVVESGQTIATRTARMVLDPVGSDVRVSMQDDHILYTAADRKAPVVAAGLFTASGAVALAAWILGRGRYRDPARDAVEVRGLVVPAGAAEATPEELARIARDEGGGVPWSWTGSRVCSSRGARDRSSRG